MMSRLLIAWRLRSALSVSQQEVKFYGKLLHQGALNVEDLSTTMIGQEKLLPPFPYSFLALNLNHAFVLKVNMIVGSKFVVKKVNRSWATLSVCIFNFCIDCR